MYPLAQYRGDALDLEAESFARKYARYFLVHISSQGAVWNEDMQWMTMHVKTGQTAVTPEVIGSWAAPVLKRPGNPHPDRISIGRARSCDIVLRYSYISKLHAYILEKGGAYSLQDLGSANGSKVNGVRLSKGDTVRLEPGDRLSFGQLELRFVDATVLHAELRRPEPPASSRPFGARPQGMHEGD